MTILETRALKKYYGQGSHQIRAVDNVDLVINEGEFIVIVGSSGSGKTTLLNLLGGLDRPTSGQVIIGGKDIFAMNNRHLTIFRRRQIGFVFQSYNLIPVLSTWENVTLPLELDAKPIDQDYLEDLLLTLNLADKKSTLPSQLSGGQQQRAAIARALATRPSIILADEPTGNLDSRSGLEVVHLLKNSVKRYHQTLVMITHNETLAQMADRRVRLEDGKIAV